MSVQLAEPPATQTPSPTSRAVEFDFDKKQSRPIPVAEAPASCARGLSCWVDLDSREPREVEAALRSLRASPLAIE